MSDAVGVALVVLVGMQLAPQAPVNGALGRVVGGLGAAFANFSIGLLLLVLAGFAAGQLGEAWGVWEAPIGHLAGGFLGATAVLLALLCVRAIGAGGVAAATVTGQLIASVALDASGSLGLDRKPLSGHLLLGALAVLAGTGLIVLGRRAPADDRSTAAGLPPWKRAAAALAVVAAGALMGVQHPVNAELGSEIGDLPAAIANFAIGGAALLVATIASGQAPRPRQLRGVRWYYLTGGLFGAVYVLGSLSLVDQIGAGALAAAAVTGQMLASLLLDRAGVLGLERRPLSAERLAGAALLVGGTVLVAL